MDDKRLLHSNRQILGYYACSQFPYAIPELFGSMVESLEFGAYTYDQVREIDWTTFSAEIYPHSDGLVIRASVVSNVKEDEHEGA